MPEHQQIQQSKKTNTIFQKQATPVVQTPVSNPYSIIQRAKINPKSLTHADIMQLQRTIGNRAVGRLLSGIGNTSTVQQAPVQRQEIPEEEEPFQGKMTETVQRQEITEEEEPLQGKFESIQRQEIPEDEEPLHIKRENNTGMPDNLKAGVESLSGIDISDVRVDYYSSKPAEVGALAYTQGTNIHVAPGQERHLPHEAWHVVQQMQGRVKPTFQMKGMAVDDEERLEREADLMGHRAGNYHISNSFFQKKIPTTTSNIQKNVVGKVIEKFKNSNKSISKDLKVIQCYQEPIQVPYDNPIATEARKARMDNKDFTGVNYATFWVNGSPTTRSSDQFHSEKMCWLTVSNGYPQLQNIKITTWPGHKRGNLTADQVKQLHNVSISPIYTEREPCGNCAPVLGEILPTNAPVYYTFDYASEITSKFDAFEYSPEQGAANVLNAMMLGITEKETSHLAQQSGRKQGNKELKTHLKKLRASTHPY